MMQTRRFLSRVTGVVLALAVAAPVMISTSFAQQTWPRRTVRFIVPFAPGAGADIGARLAADVLTRKWGQAVVVENRPGGDSLIAIRAVINENDDHTFLFSPAGNFTPHPYLHEKLGYDRAKDLLAIARFSQTVLGVGVTNKQPVKTLQDLIDLARKKPGALNVMLVPGITEFVWDGFTKTLGLEFTKVPYTNLTAGAAEMATGRIDAVMSAMAIMQPVLQSNDARLIAVTSRERVSIVKDVPTAIESGVPSLELEGLVGLFGSKAVTPELRKRIGEDVSDVARLPDVASKLVASGQVPSPGGADEFEASMARQEGQIAAIAKVIGLSRKN